MKTENDNMKTKSLRGLGFYELAPQDIKNPISIPLGFDKGGIWELEMNEKGGGMLLLADSVSKIEALQETAVLMGCMKYSPEELKVVALSKNFALARELNSWALPHLSYVGEKEGAGELYSLLKGLLVQIERREQKLLLLSKILNKQIDTVEDFNRAIEECRMREAVPLDREIVLIDDVYGFISEEDEQNLLIEMLGSIIQRGSRVGIYTLAGARPVDIDDYKITKSVSPYVRTKGCFSLENGAMGGINLGIEFQDLCEELEEMGENQLLILDNDKKSLVEMAEYDQGQKEEYVNAIKDNYCFFQRN